MTTRLLALHRLKFNPFTSDIPTEALHEHPALTNFCWRIEHAFIRVLNITSISPPIITLISPL
jgi:general secretion pathway protein A